MKKSLLSITLGVAVISAGFYYIASDLISTNATTLSLVSSNAYPKPGEEFNVQVVMTTKKMIDGVDAFIAYDPAFLEVVAVPVGDSIFDDYPGSFKGNGVVAFSAGIRGGGELVSGLGTVGAVTFKALKEGKTSLSLQHEVGSTRDSNVSSSGVDVLEGVKGVNITISSTTPRGK